MSADVIARKFWRRAQVVLLAPLILLGGLATGLVIGIFGIMEAVDDISD